MARIYLLALLCFYGSCSDRDDCLVIIHNPERSLALRSKEFREATAERSRTQAADRKSKGLQVGPKRSVDYETIRQLRAKGYSKSRIAQKLNCGIRIIDSALRETNTTNTPKEGL